MKKKLLKIFLNKIIYLYNFIFIYIKFTVNLWLLKIDNIKINGKFENIVFLTLLRRKYKIHKSIVKRLKTHGLKISLSELHIYNIEVTSLRTNFKCTFSCDRCNKNYSCHIYPNINEIWSFDQYRVMNCNEQIIKDLLE